ncbi:Lrp/AsnC family transcriptional regulator [Alterinioella nitratireducens]|uniref:Lrp/AsnC family transcriptional regulator n=1 Tax=Alterinioella nitratireducens TaxID=2735915 RepID=UPI0015552BEF|nr:Lrp/AsnC family transcriptional regulator [Alterinioella nitratireducens]NPD20447.1 Lrp/AsnC family transcriptional regulator [Alterinioella nitratireducens]
MDSKDRQILRALQQDGRMANLELAERVSLSPSPCLRRLRNLEASGAIRGFHADVDRAAYGLPILAFVQIRLERHSDEIVRQFEARISTLAEVLECYMLTGGTDYFLKVVVSGLDAYEDFIRHRIHTIGGIGSIDTSFVYGTVKRSGVFPRID